MVLGFSLRFWVLVLYPGSQPRKTCPEFVDEPLGIPAVLNSGVGCVLQAELSVVAALMPPDDFDVALMRPAQSEALSHR